MLAPVPPKTAERFQRALLRWYAIHGRHDLPWQQTQSPYAIWLSEIMLQQTQVQTVIPYYQKFLARFPTIQDLAAAPLDTVLGLWAGLGYYARGRNLHATAQRVCAAYAGEFPMDLDALMELPGIGRSTAGAILSQSAEIWAPILDANVKRVLCRVHAIPAATESTLWALAAAYTPRTQLRDYTQAMMDLGALVCRPTQPQCNVCPLQSLCAGALSGDPTQFPEKKKRKPLPVRSQEFVLILEKGGRVLLQKRPAKGIWGGLWALPVWEGDGGLLATYPHDCLPIRRHTFTHFHLDYGVRVFTVARCPRSIQTHWPDTTLVDIIEALSWGLPTPIKRLLTRLSIETATTA